MQKEQLSQNNALLMVTVGKPQRERGTREKAKPIIDNPKASIWRQSTQEVLTQLKICYKSVGESVISVKNKHNSQIRNIGDKIANQELFVSFNGTDLHLQCTLERIKHPNHTTNTAN